MRSLVNSIFYFCIAIIPLGIFFRTKEIPSGDLMLVIGLLGVLIYWSARTIRDLSIKSSPPLVILLQISLILMTVTIFSRYLYHTFWDYPTIIIIPFFIAVLTLSAIKVKRKDCKLVFTSLLFLILIIPIFGVADFHKSPRQFIPTSWYDRYDVDKSVTITLPWKFEKTEGHECSETSFKYKQNGDFELAISSYKKCLKIEQNPTFYFELSECYARTNKLELAISMLDSVILLDPSYAPTYNNRGLLNYKLKQNKRAINDYQIAIELDSSFAPYHANLVLAYYYEKQFDKACQQLVMVEEMGIDISKRTMLNRIKKLKCD